MTLSPDCIVYLSFFRCFGVFDRISVICPQKAHMLQCFAVGGNIAVIGLAVRFCDLSDNSARIAGGYTPVGDILCHNAACTYYRIIAYMHTGKDDGIAADPHVIAYSHADAVLIKCVSCCRVDWMAGCIDRDIGCHLAVVSDNNGSYIDDSAVVVRKEVLSDMDMAAVITEEWGIDHGTVRGAQEFFHNFGYAVEVRTVHEIQFLKDNAAFLLFFQHCVISDIQYLFVSALNVVQVCSPISEFVYEFEIGLIIG